MQRKGRARAEAARRRRRAERKSVEREREKVLEQERLRVLTEEAKTKPPRPLLVIVHHKYCKSSVNEAPKVGGAVCVRAWRNLRPNTARMKEIGNVVTSWHGTGMWAIPNIADDELKPGKHGMFGAGIYTAPNVSKAAVYAKGSATVDNLGREHFFLLRCRVALGNTYNATNTDWGKMDLAANGYHSISANAGPLFGAWGGAIRRGEYVVYHSDQVVVERVFEFAMQYERMDKCGFASYSIPTYAPPKVPAWKTSHPCLIRGRLCKYVYPGRTDGKCVIGNPVNASRCMHFTADEKVG